MWRDVVMGEDVVVGRWGRLLWRRRWRWQDCSCGLQVEAGGEILLAMKPSLWRGRSFKLWPSFAGPAMVSAWSQRPPFFIMDTGSFLAANKVGDLIISRSSTWLSWEKPVFTLGRNIKEGAGSTHRLNWEDFREGGFFYRVGSNVIRSWFHTDSLEPRRF